MTKKQMMRPYRLHAHESGEKHIAAILRLIDPTMHNEDDNDNNTPTQEHYETLLAWLRKGGSIRDGVPGVGTFRKVKKMTFTCAEGLKRLYRGWLRTCYTINLLRGERHSRFLIRFRCADLKGVATLVSWLNLGW